VRVFSIFCTYISERVFITVPDKPERGFKRNVRYRKAGRTRQAAGTGKHPSEAAARGNKPLRFLPDVIHGTCRGGGRTYSAGTETAAWGVFGAMLLREDAGGYVLVAVVSFAAAAAITALCFRLRIRENQKKDGTDKPDPQEQEEKSQ